MVNGRIREKTKDRFKLIMQDVIKGLGRRIQVYKQSIRSECPNCFFDKMANSSTGKCKWTALEAQTKQTEYETTVGNVGGLMYKFFKVGRCPVCKGKGFLETHRKVWVDALVTWNPENRNNAISYTSAGTEGATLIELKTDIKFFELFKSCEKVVVDGTTCKLAKVPVIRGLGNKTVLVVTVFTTDTIALPSDEILKKY